jgi:type VI secretion system secreted protein VgrG
MVSRFDVPFSADRISSVLPIDPGEAPFELRAGPWSRPDLAVLSFHGREAISHPFRFDITMATSMAVDDATLESELLARPACLTMRAGASGPRYVRGVVASLCAESRTQGGRATYRLRLVPAFALLKHRVTSRIFQDRTVPDIVSAVLGEAGIAHTLRLLGKYRRRTYCVQHQASDFAFVARLLAEEGIFYAFEHGGADAASETMILSDDAHLYPPIKGDPGLAYRPSEGAAGLAIEEHHVQRFSLRRSLRPTSVLRRSYDFRRPLLDLQATAALADMEGGEAPRGEIYEHHEKDEDPDVRDERVAAELGQHRARIEEARGSSGCRRLVPGARFTLRDHDLDRLDGEYVLTRVEHEGRAPEVAHGGEAVYANTFACAPADVTTRPRRPVRAVQQVTETAVVVGPAGQEIYTDDLGRVKVQFPWDREGKRDDRSSCWMRVSQTWAGSGWGFQFVPRVGMEVIVTFLGGDVDRPLITGCVANTVNVPPFPLPEQRTRSGIRTQSTSGGGGGYNEIAFEDARGQEELSIRAQRDLLEGALRDHDTRVGRDRTVVVVGALREQAGRKAVEVGGDAAETTHGDVLSRCEGNRAETIGGAGSLEVQGSRSATVAKDDVLHVAGHCDVVVGTPGAGSYYSLAVRGDHLVGAEGIRINATRALTLRCGESVLELRPEGIRISGKAVEVIGTESASLSGRGPALRLGENAELTAPKLRLFSSDARLLLDENARLNGKLVKLNCDDEKSANDKGGDAAKETKPLKMKLSDAEYGVYANKRYQVLVDGALYEGTTDAGGMVDKKIPKEAKSVSIVLWTDTYPTGPQRTWTLRVDGEAPSPVRAAQQRLANLGYYDGEPSGELDDRTQGALRDFQEHAGLPSTGELDAATTEKLNAVHGA